MRFRDGIASLHDLGYRVFVEIGPRPALLVMARRCQPGDTGLWLPSLRENGRDWQSMLDALGALYVHGAAADWEGFDRDLACRQVVLPTYPFQRKRYWLADHAEVGQADPQPHTAATPAHTTPPASSQAGPQDVKDWLYQVEWRPQPSATAEPADPAGHWLILGDSGGIGRELAQLLGRHSATVNLVFAESWQQHQESVFADLPACRGVVHLWGLDAAPQAENMSLSSLQHDQAIHCGSVLDAVKALAAAPGMREAPRLWIVTRGAQPAGPADPRTSVTQSPLWGLGRVIALEHPEIWGGLIDLDPASPAPAAADDAMRLLESISARSAASTEDSGQSAAADDGPTARGDQSAWRAGTRYAPRLTRASSEPAAPAPEAARASSVTT